jgi:hypothetical protein
MCAQFKFVVDGQWKYDPNIAFESDAYGNINNYIEVRSCPALMLISVFVCKLLLLFYFRHRLRVGCFRQHHQLHRGPSPPPMLRTHSMIEIPMSSPRLPTPTIT